MNEPKYQIGDRIPGTIGQVVSKTFSSNGQWVYCIAFDEGFLTIAEHDIDTSIIEVLNPPDEYRARERTRSKHLDLDVAG